MQWVEWWPQIRLAWNGTRKYGPWCIPRDKGYGGVYTQELSQYQVAVANVLIPNCRVIVFFYREVDHFALEALRLHGPNVVIFHLSLGR